MSKFEAKYDPEAIRNAIEKQRDSIIAQQKERQAEQEKLENMTRIILGDANIPTPFYPPYLNFARQIWKLRVRFTGETLKTEANIIIAKWVSRRLEENVLIRIRNEVFTLQAP
jgi:hypothetical protein